MKRVPPLNGEVNDGYVDHADNADHRAGLISAAPIGIGVLQSDIT